MKIKNTIESIKSRYSCRAFIYKSTALVLLFAFLISLSGCRETLSQYNTVDNPVPLGETEKIYSHRGVEAEITIIEVISGEEARKIVDPDSNDDYTLVKVNVQILSLPNGTFSPFSLRAITQEGLEVIGVLPLYAEERIGMKSMSSITFATESSVDCFVLFRFNIDNISCLSYPPSFQGDDVYFAIR